MTDLTHSRPTYYVRHPDGSISIARPQPSAEDIERQRDYVFAQCDHKHGGGTCQDPSCYHQTTVVRRPRTPPQGSKEPT